jgi:hypothetical protein
MTTSYHYIEMGTERMQKGFIRLLGVYLSQEHRLEQTESCKELEAFSLHLIYIIINNDHLANV